MAKPGSAKMRKYWRDYQKKCAERDPDYWKKKVIINRRSYKKSMKKNPLYSFGHNLMRRYSITVDDYAQMLATQLGVCAICGYAPSGKKRSWLHVDHDHSDSSIRGLLCTWCNLGLGSFKDDPEILNNARIYLISHKERETLRLILEGIPNDSQKKL